MKITKYKASKANQNVIRSINGTKLKITDNDIAGILSDHKNWYEGKSDVKSKKFIGDDICFTSQSQKYFEYAFLTSSILTRVAFVNIYFKNFSFANTNMEKVVFKGCSFSKCDFTFAKLSKCTFEKCTFEDCDFKHSTQVKTVFIDSRINNDTKFTHSILRSNGFIGCDIKDVSFYKVNIYNTTIFTTTFYKVNFNESKMKDIKVNTCEFRECNFYRTTYHPKDHQYVMILGCNLIKADFSEIAISTSELNGSSISPGIINTILSNICESVNGKEVIEQYLCESGIIEGEVNECLN